MNKFHKISAILFMLLIIGAACHKEYFDFDKLSTEIELEPELVAPLVYGRVTMEDIVELIDSADVLDVDEEGLLYVTYSDTLFEAKADTLVEISDEVVTKYYIESDITGDPGWGVDIGDTIFFQKWDTLRYGLDGNDRLDSMLIKEGDLRIDLHSEFRHTGFLTISSHNFTDENKNPVETEIQISDLSGDFRDQKIIPLDDYFVITDHEQKNDSLYSFVVIEFNLALIYSGNDIAIGEECQVDIAFLDTDFSEIYGFIDERELITESGEIDIPLYDEQPDLANIIFADPQINIYTNNSVGVTLELELENMIATSSIDGSTIEMTFDGINPFEIGAPTIEQVGESIHTEININRNTSNIDEIFAGAPEILTYDFTGRTIINSLEDEHFVLDQSEMDMMLEFVLPLHFKSEGFALTDTIDFELFGEDGLDTALIKFLQLDLETDNGLPIEFEVQLYFTDETYTVIDSLFDRGEETILKAAPVDPATGIITYFEHDSTLVDIDREKLANLYNVRYAIFEATILTTPPPAGGEFDYVKIYKNYEGLDFEPAYALDFDLSVYGGLNINTQELDN